VHVWVAGAGTIVCVDHLFYDWFAMSSSQITGKHCSTLVSMEDRGRLQR
jgi:hypothetical protein